MLALLVEKMRSNMNYWKKFHVNWLVLWIMMLFLLNSNLQMRGGGTDCSCFVGNFKKSHLTWDGSRLWASSLWPEETDICSWNSIQSKGQTVWLTKWITWFERIKASSSTSAFSGRSSQKGNALRLLPHSVSSLFNRKFPIVHLSSIPQMNLWGQNSQMCQKPSLVPLSGHPSIMAHTWELRTSVHGNTLWL